MFEDMDSAMDQMIEGAANAMDQLANEEVGEKIIDGLAVVCVKLRNKLVKQGFDRQEALKIVVAIMGRK